MHMARQMTSGTHTHTHRHVVRYRNDREKICYEKKSAAVKGCAILIGMFARCVCDMKKLTHVFDIRFYWYWALVYLLLFCCYRFLGVDFMSWWNSAQNARRRQNEHSNNCQLCTHTHTHIHIHLFHSRIWFVNIAYVRYALSPYQSGQFRMQNETRIVVVVIFLPSLSSFAGLSCSDGYFRTANERGQFYSIHMLPWVTCCYFHFFSTSDNFVHSVFAIQFFLLCVVVVVVVFCWLTFVSSSFVIWC